MLPFHFSIHLIMQQRRQPEHVVDVGINRFLYLEFWDRLFNRVTGFEPAPSAFDKISEQIKKYNSNKIKLYPYAAGKYNDDVEFWVNLKDNAYSGSSTRRVNYLRTDKHLFEESDWKKITVEMKPLDAVIPPDNPVTLIKSDSESNDLFVIEGAFNIIDRDRPLLQFEHIPGYDKDRLLDIMSIIKYKQVTPYIDIDQYYFAPMEWNV